MPLADFDQLYQHADGLLQPLGIAVAGGADRTVLQALRKAADRRWVDPILVGRLAEIRRIAAECEVPLSRFRIVDADDVATAAVALVRSGAARLLMKGQVSTQRLLAAVLDKQHGLRSQRVVAQIVLMEIVSAERRFLMADTGICVQPSVEQKVDILRSAVSLAHSLGEPAPRVAFMAATEKVTEKMPETVEADQIQELARMGEFPDCSVRGPLSFDLAYSADAAQKKQQQDHVAGGAEVMIFPNLVSANLTVKAIMYTADCRFGGMLAGTSCPVVFMSRADSTVTRLNSLALALATIK